MKGKYLVKIKGSKIKEGLNISVLDNLLFKGSSKPITHIKWYKSFTNSTVNIIEILYTLKHTENKRAIVYLNNKFAYTVPFVIKDNIKISKGPGHRL